MTTENFENRITELETKIKELLANYPEHQVYFEFDYGECEWKGEQYEEYDFSLYEESNGYWGGYCLVESISLNDHNELVYSLLASGVTPDGDGYCESLGDWTIKQLINRKIYSQEQAEKVIETLEFFTDIL